MAGAVRAPDFAAPEASIGVASLSIPNINSTTGLSTDYRDAVLRNMATPELAAALALRATDWFKPLIARMSAVINGTANGPFRADTQAAIDEIFRQ